MALVLRPDRHQHAGDLWMGRERRYGMAQYGAAAQPEILLRQFAAEAGAAPGGDDQGIGRSHRNRLNQRAGSRQQRLRGDMASACQRNFASVLTTGTRGTK